MKNNITINQANIENLIGYVHTLLDFIDVEDFEDKENAELVNGGYESFVKPIIKTLDKSMEDLNMNNRANAIANFAQKRDAEVAAKKKQAEDREEFLKRTILGWSDRIQELIETANACVEHGVPICHSYINGRNYDDDYFRTDGCSHILGFEFNHCHPSPITRIGKEGGGYDHYNVFTDGKTITATGDDRLWALERFVEKFDEFETKFYAYVDKVCQSK